MSLNPADRPSCLELLQDPYFELGQSLILLQQHHQQQAAMTATAETDNNNIPPQ
jgi:hypothetical protein